MLANIEVWQCGAGLVLAVLAGALVSAGAMSRFLKRPSPSEAIIRIGRSSTDVFIGRATWIVPIPHRAATLSLSTIGLTIRRAGHDALVTKDFISTNLCAEFYIRVEPAEDDVKKAARTLGIDEGHATPEAIRKTGQELLEPKLVGALRAVAAQNDFLALHMNREHFAQEVSKALREDLGRNGFTLESVTITELAQTPLSDMRADAIFGASGRQTVAQVAEAEREKQVAVVAAQKAAEQERIAADIEAYKRKLRAQTEADAAEKQAQSITRIAEANREAGLKEAEVQRQKLAAMNSKSRELLLQETAMKLLEVAPAVVRELVKPAERIGEIKVLQLGGAGGIGAGTGTQPGTQLLGGALGP